MLKKLVSPATIVELTHERMPVYCKYGTQSNPQPAYICISPEEQYPITVTYEAGINSSSYDAFLGREKHIPISSYAEGTSILEFITEHAEQLTEIIAGYESEWDGGNLVGSWSQASEEELEELRYRALYDIGECIYIENPVDLGLVVDKDDDPVELAHEVWEDLVAENYAMDFSIDDLIKYIVRYKEENYEG